MTALARCDREIAAIKQHLRGECRDVYGLVRALTDWAAERKLILGQDPRECGLGCPCGGFNE